MEKRTRKVILAVILILLAAYMVLSRLNIPIIGKISIFGNVGVWGIIWSIVMLCILWDGLTKRDFFLIFVPIAIFGSIHAEAFHITAITPWPLIGAAVLLSIACKILMPGRHDFHINVNGKEGVIRSDKDGRYIEYKDGTRADWESTMGEETDDSVETNFGSTVKYFNSPNFTHAAIECNFGSVKAYFVDAIMQEPIAYISVEQNFGQTDLFIPKNWNAQIVREKAFGSISEIGNSEGDGSHVVQISAEANFGSVNIHYV